LDIGLDEWDQHFLNGNKKVDLVLIWAYTIDVVFEHNLE
jgi:hypothetical protein